MYGIIGNILILISKKLEFKMVHSTIKFFLILLLLASFNSYSQTQNVYAIRGLVQDETTKESLPNVNVFLDGTTLGTTTDYQGRFEIKNLSPGSYRIIASMMGYKRQDKSILLLDSKITTVNFSLQLLSYKLDQIYITTERDSKWDNDFRLFRRSFIGTSENSTECEILNKEVLEFKSTGDTKLIATSLEPLEILNNALGYKVNFELKDFELGHDDEVSFWGSTLFNELTTDDQDIRNKWIQNRGKAFYGSFRHFLISISKNELEENGFYTYEVEFPDWSDIRRQNYRSPNIEKITGRVTSVERVLQFDDYIMVTYMSEWEEPDFRIYRNYLGSKIYKELSHQTSWIILPYGVAMFDINGNILDNYRTIKVFGYWGWQKVSDLLPTDYKPVGE